jgi:hypothetical protein
MRRCQLRNRICTTTSPLPSNQVERDWQKLRQGDHKFGLVVAEGDKLYLLPVHGSDTQWYRNVLKNPKIHVDARGAEAELRVEPITKANAVTSVIEKFREKYGAGDVTRYYSKLDVAVETSLPKAG